MPRAASRGPDASPPSSGGYGGSNAGGAAAGGGAEVIAAKAARRATSVGKVLRDKISDTISDIKQEAQQGNSFFFRNMTGYQRDGEAMLKEEQMVFAQRRDGQGSAASTPVKDAAASGGGGGYLTRGISAFRQVKAKAQSAAEKAAAAVEKAAAPKTPVKSPMDVKVDNICALGFSPAVARDALRKSGGDADLACNLLIEDVGTAPVTKAEDAENGATPCGSTPGGNAASSSSSTHGGSSSSRSSARPSQMAPEEYLSFALQDDDPLLVCPNEESVSNQRELLPMSPERPSGLEQDPLDDGRGLGTKRQSWVACPHALASASKEQARTTSKDAHRASKDEEPTASEGPTLAADEIPEEHKEIPATESAMASIKLQQLEVATALAICSEKSGDIAAATPRPSRHSLPSAFAACHEEVTEEQRQEERRATAEELEIEDNSEEEDLLGVMMPPDSECWEWPLSRQEKKTRMHQLERHMRTLDKRTLMKELVDLRVRWRKFEQHSVEVPEGEQTCQYDVAIEGSC